MQSVPSASQEARVRRHARRKGYIVRRSRWRINTVDNLGKFRLIEAYRNMIVLGERFDATLEEKTTSRGSCGRDRTVQSMRRSRLFQPTP